MDADSVKKYSSGLSLGLAPAVPRAGRPPVLGLVARREVPARLLLSREFAPLSGVCAPSLTLALSCVVSRLTVSRRTELKASLTGPSFRRRLSQDHPSCSSIASHALLWRLTPSAAPGVLKTRLARVRGHSFPETGPVTAEVTLGPCCTFCNDTEEELAVADSVQKYISGACPVLGLVLAVPWAGRPPVLGLVALAGGARVLLFGSLHNRRLRTTSYWCRPCCRFLCRARFMASTPSVLQQSRTLRCGVPAGSPADGASDLVSMSLTRPFIRPH